MLYTIQTAQEYAGKKYNKCIMERQVPRVPNRSELWPPVTLDGASRSRSNEVVL